MIVMIRYQMVQLILAAAEVLVVQEGQALLLLLIQIHLLPLLLVLV